MILCSTWKCRTGKEQDRVDHRTLQQGKYQRYDEEFWMRRAVDESMEEITGRVVCDINVLYTEHTLEYLNNIVIII